MIANASSSDQAVTPNPSGACGYGDLIQYAISPASAIASPPLAEQQRSLAGPAARNAISRKTVVPARSSETLFSAAAQLVVAAEDDHILVVEVAGPLERVV